MDRVSKAFAQFDRVGFVPADVRHLAVVDMALPIGYDQTISQPSTVEMMLGWLDVQLGNRVLDVGSGSGWTTALLSYLTGPRGQVFAVELAPGLLEFGRQNAARAGATNASFHPAGDEHGLPQYGPYDRILVSAAADELPPELLAQLKPGGKMVIPVRSTVLEISKNRKGKAKIAEHPGFAFVPLI